MGVKNKKWTGNTRGQLRDLRTITQQMYDRNQKRIFQGKEAIFTVDQINAVSAANQAADSQLSATKT